MRVINVVLNSSTGKIALILAAQEGHSAVVKTLIDAGSAIDHRSHDGKSALRVAALEGHRDTVSCHYEK